MAISRAQLTKQLLPGLNVIYGQSYASYPEEHKEIFQLDSSDRSFEEDLKISGFGPGETKSEGAGVGYDSAQEVYSSRYTHETVALAFALTEEAVEDQQYEKLAARYTKALARAMAHTKQVKAAAILNNGFSGSFLGGDGVSLFGNNSGGTRVGHPLLGGGANFNSPSVAADLNETSLEDAIITMSQWKDERGLFIVAKGRKLVIPSQLQFVATRLLETELRSSVQATAATFAPNDINAIKTNGVVPGGYTINHYLTDPNAWFLLSDVPDSLKHFVRTPLKQSMDEDFDTGNIRYKVRERYCFGWSDALGIYGSPGA